MKKILLVGAEAMPFAATGGLGDVLGSLPAALAAAPDTDVRVMMPLYAQIPDSFRKKMKTEAVFTVKLAWREQYCGILSLKRKGVTYYFVDNEYYFHRAALYGSFDDGERFAFFSMAVLESLWHLGFFPDVLHANDWQSALTVVYLDRLYRQRPGYTNIRSVFTIHNIEYQGKYDFYILGDVFSLGADCRDLMNFGGCINLMKAAIVVADRVTTVSPRYAEEICTPAYGHGLDGILRDNRGKLSGILNGIDYDYYNPGQDAEIPVKYNRNTLSRKVENKTALQRELGLPEDPDVPMLAIVSRLAAHKGMDLAADIMPRLLFERNVQLVVLGRGEAGYENFFRDLERRFPAKVRAMILYDRALAKRIYAACDIFLMPSKSEPCGLSQMVASRYGAIPVTRETGGLFDSIKGYWKEEKDGKTVLHGNGFTFANYRSEELSDRISAALDLYEDPATCRLFVRKIMQIDFSWKQSAAGYLALYHAI